MQLHAAVFNWVQSFNSDKKTAQASAHECYHSTPNSGSMKPSGSSQGDECNM